MASACIYVRVNNDWYYYDPYSRPLGSGSFGVVYLGYNYYTGEPVAIKMIHAQYVANPVVRQHIFSEAQMSFMHRNIVKIFGITEQQGCLYIISEFINGLNIDTYCNQSLAYVSGKVRTDYILHFSTEILSALEYLHQIGVIHGDIKPSNIMVTSEGVTKLVDMGIARFRSSVTTESSFIGTYSYAAPELINCDDVDFRVDIYAMGITVYELITGSNPFDDVDSRIIPHKQFYMELPPSEMIDPALMAILTRAVHKDRYQRISSAAEFSYELNNYLNVSDSNKISHKGLHGFKNWWKK